MKSQMEIILSFSNKNNKIMTTHTQGNQYYNTVPSMTPSTSYTQQMMQSCPAGYPPGYPNGYLSPPNVSVQYTSAVQPLSLPLPNLSVPLQQQSQTTTYQYYNMPVQTTVAQNYTYDPLTGTQYYIPTSQVTQYSTYPTNQYTTTTQTTYLPKQQTYTPTYVTPQQYTGLAPPPPPSYPQYYTQTYPPK